MLITKSLQKISNKLKIVYTEPRIVLILIVENASERDDTLAKIVEFVLLIEFIEVNVNDDIVLTMLRFNTDKEDTEFNSLFKVL